MTVGPGVGRFGVAGSPSSLRISGTSRSTSARTRAEGAMRPADGGGSTAVVADRLTVSYGPAVVLDRFDLTVFTGTAVALVGENGAGKSTLLRCIAGIQAPTDGGMRVFDGVPG